MLVAARANDVMNDANARLITKMKLWLFIQYMVHI